MGLNPKSISAIGYLLLAISLLGGCLTIDSSKKQDEVAQMRSSVSEELIKLKQDIKSLKGQLDELQFRINKISQMQSQQSKELNTTLKEWRKDTQNDIEKRIAGVESKLQTLEKRQGQDKKELQDRTDIIVEEVTKENKELRKQIETIRTSRSYISEEGYYVVSEGDTLSKISQGFGVSIKSIMEANNITDPNSIRKGQKLIIPKKR